jgi:hypothetical protein
MAQSQSLLVSVSSLTVALLRVSPAITIIDLPQRIRADRPASRM